MMYNNLGRVIKLLKEGEPCQFYMKHGNPIQELDFYIYGDDATSLISLLERYYAKGLAAHIESCKKELEALEYSIKEADWRENDE